MSWQGYIAERRGHIGTMIGLAQAAQRLRAGSVGRVYDLYEAIATRIGSERLGRLAASLR